MLVDVIAGMRRRVLEPHYKLKIFIFVVMLFYFTNIEFLNICILYLCRDQNSFYVYIIININAFVVSIRLCASHDFSLGSVGRVEIGYTCGSGGSRSWTVTKRTYRSCLTSTIHASGCSNLHIVIRVVGQKEQVSEAIQGKRKMAETHLNVP